MNHLVFISHSSQDNTIVRKLYDSLTEKGVKCWIDRGQLDHDVFQGSEYQRAIATAIENSTIFALVLSPAAESSGWVNRELAFALQKERPVCAIKLEATIRDSAINLMLSTTNVIDASIPPHDEGIRKFVQLICDSIQEVLANEDEPLASQTRLKLLEVDATDEQVNQCTHFLNGAKARELGRFFREGRRQIEGMYFKTRNPYQTYEFYNSCEVQGLPLKATCDTAEQLGCKSLELAKLFVSISYFLINDGNIGFVHDARNYLERAISIIDGISDYNETVSASSINARWLLSITYKQERNYAMAIEILEQLLPDAESDYHDFDIGYAASILLPRREMAIINQDEDEFDYLVEHRELYRDDKREYFFTLRRAFEFYIFNGCPDKATAILDDLLAAYTAVEASLEPVYYYALQFNMFVYLWACGRKDDAETLYQMVEPEMREHHFTRYAQQLENQHANMIRGRGIRTPL